MGFNEQAHQEDDELMKTESSDNPSDYDWQYFFAQSLVLDAEGEAFMTERPMNKKPASKAIF